MSTCLQRWEDDGGALGPLYEYKVYPTARAWDECGNEVPVDEGLRAHWSRLLRKAMR